MSNQKSITVTQLADEMGKTRQAIWLRIKNRKVKVSYINGTAILNDNAVSKIKAKRKIIYG